LSASRSRAVIAPDAPTSPGGDRAPSPRRRRRPREACLEIGGSFASATIAMISLAAVMSKRSCRGRRRPCAEPTTTLRSAVVHVEARTPGDLPRVERPLLAAGRPEVERVVDHRREEVVRGVMRAESPVK